MYVIRTSIYVYAHAYVLYRTPLKILWAYCCSHRRSSQPGKPGIEWLRQTTLKHSVELGDASNRIRREVVWRTGPLSLFSCLLSSRLSPFLCFSTSTFFVYEKNTSVGQDASRKGLAEMEAKGRLEPMEDMQRVSSSSSRSSPTKLAVPKKLFGEQPSSVAFYFWVRKYQYDE